MTEPNFSFDYSGQFIFVQTYLLGATLQIQRYQNAAKRSKKSRKISALFEVMHEASCLLEDLMCITEYFKQGGFKHPKDKLWKQARHHIRHDMRDLIIDKGEIAQTRKRNVYFNFKPGLISQIKFTDEEITLGELSIFIDEVEDYLNWADSIFQKYVDYIRLAGRLKNI